MKKSLRNLAKVAAGLGAAYALTKMGKTETSEADSLRMQNQADQEDASRAAFANASKTSSPTTLNPKTGIYGEPGSLEGFKASEEARRARIFGTGTKEIDPGSPKAKLAARLNRSKGGSVIARGNKLARSKPTKLF